MHNLTNNEFFRNSSRSSSRMDLNNTNYNAYNDRTHNIPPYLDGNASQYFDNCDDKSELDAPNSPNVLCIPTQTYYRSSLNQNNNRMPQNINPGNYLTLFCNLPTPNYNFHMLHHQHHYQNFPEST